MLRQLRLKEVDVSAGKEVQKAFTNIAFICTSLPSGTHFNTP